ncbi:hypothetical protein CDAR_123271 [Caerostris darwini]|uniref:Uncharacterized protein n=1 Tax=Caerostris darwini TaxID=1538125 RepID=A0AAV4QB71_9ARAC|nr:hypothetical protein CDAR_123271 [Caerostris darwini]
MKNLLIKPHTQQSSLEECGSEEKQRHGSGGESRLRRKCPATHFRRTRSSKVTFTAEQVPLENSYSPAFCVRRGVESSVAHMASTSTSREVPQFKINRLLNLKIGL